MLFPHWLYQLTPRDDQSTGPEIFNGRARTSLAAAAIDGVGFVVPRDRVCILASLSGFVNPGGAQTITAFEVYLSLAGAAPPDVADPRWMEQLFGLPNASFSEWNNYQMVGPGQGVFARAAFSAGAVANELVLNWNGVLIPRGNFALA